MYSLYIDTHDKEIVLCLYKDGKVLDKNIKNSTRNHSDYTMPMLKELLDNNDQNNTDLEDLPSEE